LFLPIFKPYFNQRMNDANISLPDIFSSAWQWRKSILAFTIIATLIGGSIAFLVPRYYLCTATVLATNPALSDKQRIFAKNIQGLYSQYGSGDDAERLRGIAELDTCYKLMIDAFNLTAYYGYPDQSPLSLRNTIKEMKEDLFVERNDKDQLRVHCYHQNADTAAAICNKTVAFMQGMAMQISRDNNKTLLANLDAAYKKYQASFLLLSDSIRRTTNAAQQQLLQTEANALLTQVQDTKKLMEEVNIAVDNNPPALKVLEQAYATAKPEKPKRLVLVLASFFGSLIFGILAALIYNRKKTVASIG
jgi:uncharacterized protein involved in exopolysaccharide biosynthesis